MKPEKRELGIRHEMCEFKNFVALRGLMGDYYALRNSACSLRNSALQRQSRATEKVTQRYAE